MLENTPKNNSQSGENSEVAPKSPVKVCACGCNQTLTDKRAIKYNYLPWHKTRPLGFCACRCGSPLLGAKPSTRFLRGHHKRKPLKTILCEHCGTEKQVTQSSKARFCSRKCFAVHILPALRAASAAIKGRPRHYRTCAVCGNSFDRYPNDVPVTGIVYCSSECFWVARKKDELTNVSVTPAVQRKKVLALRANRCERCGYDRVPDVLQIHHRDENTRNGVMENIELLCPTCHEEEHFHRKTGRFTPRKHHGQPAIPTS